MTTDPRTTPHPDPTDADGVTPLSPVEAQPVPVDAAPGVTPPPTAVEPTPPSRAERTDKPAAEPHVTRVSAAWAFVAVALVLLVLLIIFILQNPARVQVQFLGLSASLSLGMAMLISAVAGGLVVTVVGVARLTQLRINARRARKKSQVG